MNTITFHPDGTANNWEPHPYDAPEKVWKLQLRRFTTIAEKTITWSVVKDGKFPFNLPQEAISELGISHFASDQETSYVLMDNIWFGFPDPPRWRVSQKTIEKDSIWEDCGYFSEIPDSWTVPGT